MEINFHLLDLFNPRHSTFFLLYALDGVRQNFACSEVVFVRFLIKLFINDLVFHGIFLVFITKMLVEW
jgi:hypothetical protein